MGYCVLICFDTQKLSSSFLCVCDGVNRARREFKPSYNNICVSNLLEELFRFGSELFQNYKLELGTTWWRKWLNLLV